MSNELQMGKITLTGTDSPIQLPFCDVEQGKKTWLFCPSTNSGTAYIGKTDVETKGDTLKYPIPAGSERKFELEHLNELFVAGESGDIIYYRTRGTLSEKEESE